jgi:hypothetical protein
LRTLVAILFSRCQLRAVVFVHSGGADIRRPTFGDAGRGSGQSTCDSSLGHDESQSVKSHEHFKILRGMFYGPTPMHCARGLAGLCCIGSASAGARGRPALQSVSRAPSVPYNSRPRRHEPQAWAAGRGRQSESEPMSMSEPQRQLSAIVNSIDPMPMCHDSAVPLALWLPNFVKRLRACVVLLLQPVQALLI